MKRVLCPKPYPYAVLTRLALGRNPLTVCNAYYAYMFKDPGSVENYGYCSDDAHPTPDRRHDLQP